MPPKKITGNLDKELMEFAREMLVGNERKERVNQALDNQRITKLMGYLNLNNEQDT